MNVVWGDGRCVLYFSESEIDGERRFNGGLNTNDLDSNRATD